MYGPTGGRTDYLQWDDYFVALIRVMAHRHCDENRKNFAILLNNRKIIIGTASEIDDNTDSCSDHTIHRSLEDAHGLYGDGNCTLYLREYPNCSRCVEELINHGVNQIIFINENRDDNREIEEILGKSPINCRKYQAKQRQIVLNLQ